MYPGEKVNKSKAKKTHEATGLWDYDHSYKFPYETTHSTSFVDKTFILKDRQSPIRDYSDQIWYLGYEDTDMIYRRKKLLSPINLKNNPKIDGPPLSTTNQRDYKLKFVPVKPKKEISAGLPTIFDHPNSITIDHFLKQKRPNFGKTIFLNHKEQYKRSGIQTFMDDICSGQSGQRDREVIEKKVVAGITLPLTGIPYGKGYYPHV
ncbi:hypothetical protein HDV06_004353 [Boothiomyces sp. JEL0866]|nr:hypothetical protein HDV06_004353 [Boothiomyces sp. JEL0866]